MVPAQETAFEEALGAAKTLISAAAGFRSLHLAGCVESPTRYLLLVEWEQLEDHAIGFRGSAAYQEGRASCITSTTRSRRSTTTRAGPRSADGCDRRMIPSRCAANRRTVMLPTSGQPVLRGLVRPCLLGGAGPLSAASLAPCWGEADL